MDVHLRRLAAQQRDVVATWQLFGAGWTRPMIAQRVRVHGWRAVHPGVFALNSAPLTREQRWLAAALTTPCSFLSHGSAGAHFGFRPFEAGFETIIRPGNSGRQRYGDLVVYRSRALDGDTTLHDGIPTTTAERALIDIAAYVDARDTGRSLREAVRLGLTTMPRMLAALERHRGRRGTAHLTELATRYAGVSYRKTRSDPEGRALEVLRDAGIELPEVNIRIAGEEADLVWRKRRPWLIIEIDGPQFHLFADEDARKQQLWEDAGFTVRRIPSGLVYTAPDRLIALASRA